MNKSDLVDAMAESAGITKAQAGKALDAFTDSVTGSIKEKRQSYTRRIRYILNLGT